MENKTTFIVREQMFNTFMEAWNYCKSNDISTRIIYSKGRDGEVISFNN